MLYFFLNMLARRSPVILVVLAGLIIALVRWKRHPRVSLMAALALFLYFVRFTLFTIFNYYLPNLFAGVFHASDEGVSWAYTALFFFEDLAFAGIVILLVAAAFSQRGQNPEIST
jgi:hypothetical protein